MVGGAQFLDKTGFFNIGQRNCDCFRALLRQHGLSVRAEEVGGLVSRTIHLNLTNGEVRLKTSGQTGETILYKG
jgi:chemotaxis protein CheD